MRKRPSEFLPGADLKLEVYLDGTGPALIVLPSYGRGGGEDFDYFASKFAAAGFMILGVTPPGRVAERGFEKGRFWVG